MANTEMVERKKTPENFGNRFWQDGYAHGIDGVSPRNLKRGYSAEESEEYLNGYSHGYFAPSA